MSDDITAPTDWASMPEPWRTVGLRAREQFKQLAAGQSVTPPPQPISHGGTPQKEVLVPLAPVSTEVLSTDIVALRAGLEFSSPARQAKIRQRIAELTSIHPHKPHGHTEAWECALCEAAGPLVRVPHYGTII